MEQEQVVRSEVELPEEMMKIIYDVAYKLNMEQNQRLNEFATVIVTTADREAGMAFMADVNDAAKDMNGTAFGAAFDVAELMTAYENGTLEETVATGVNESWLLMDCNIICYARRHAIRQTTRTFTYILENKERFATVIGRLRKDDYVWLNAEFRGAGYRGLLDIFGMELAQ